MKYEYVNLWTPNLPTQLSITYKQNGNVNSQNMYVKKILGADPRDPGNLARPEQFNLLHKYLDYKGVKFKTDVINLYKETYDACGDISFDSDIVRTLMSKTVKLFDLNDLEKWLVKSNLVKIPEYLPIEYVEVRGDTNTREQTYTRSDYMSLVSLYVFSKYVVGVVGELSMQISSFPSVSKGQELMVLMEYMLAADSSFSKYSAIVKLQAVLGFMVKARSAQLEDIILGKDLSMDRVETYLLTNVVLKRMPTLVQADDNKSSNLVTHSYNTVNNMLQKKTVKMSDIIPTVPNADDQSSIFESISQSSEFSPGDIFCMEWSMSDDKVVAGQMGVDLKEYKSNIKLFERLMYKGNIPESSIIIASHIMSKVLHPDCIRMVNAETVTKMLACTYTYLQMHESLKELSNLVASYIRDVNEVITGTNMSMLKISPELESHFTIRRKTLNSGAEERIIIHDTIKLITAGYVGLALYSIDVKSNNDSVSVSIPTNIRNLLADMILHLQDY